MKKTFKTDCVHSTAQAITTMTDAAHQITYRTFLKHVRLSDVIVLFSWYYWKPGKTKGLRLKDDYHVAFYLSKYRGQPCVYLVHSSIEYIFT
jgi:hypothetical protein